MLRRKVPCSARQFPEWASLLLAGGLVTLVSWCLLDAASIVLNKHRHQWQQQHASLRRQVLQGPLPQAAIKAARFKPTSPQTAATRTSWQAGSWTDHQITPQQLSTSAATSLARFPYLHDEKYWIYSHSAADTSARCASSGICDWVHEPGLDGLGNITKPADRLQKVREATQWAWKGYTRYAWGLDELDPNSKTGRDWFGVGLTIVDSVDTLLIQGLWEEAAEAREWIAHHLQLRGRSMSVFESIIRILGGLLSAFYHSGGDEMYLVRALEFADRLLPVFSTQSGVHVGTFTLGDQVVHGRSPGGMLWVGPSNLAEAGTTSLEFSTLSHMTGIPIYRQQSMRFWYDAQAKLDTLDGLFCTDLDGDSLACRQHYFTMGPSADSTYEYMLKQWILSAGQDTVCLDLYRAAMRGLRKHMVVRVRTEEEAQQGGEGHLMLATLTAHRAQQGLQVSSRHVQVEHLSCFVPGMLALGHLYGQRTSRHDAPGGSRQPQQTATTRRLAASHGRQQSSHAQPEDQEDDDLLLAARLMRGCYDLYTRARSGLAFDSARFDVAWRPVPDAPNLPPGPPTPTSAEQPLDLATSTTAQRPPRGATRHPARAAGGRIGNSDSAALSPDRLARDNSDSHALQGSSARRLRAWSQQVQAGALSAVYAAWPIAKQHTAAAGSYAWATTKRAVGMGWTAALSLAAALEPNQAPAYVTLQTAHSNTGISGLEHARADVMAVDGAPAGPASTARTAQSAAAAAAQPGIMQQHAAVTGTVGRHLLARAQHQQPQQGARPAGSQADDDLDNQVFQFQPLTHANFLRPEVVESLFYLYRATGDPVYQEWGWNIFRAYERWCRVEQGGYITMMNVDAVPPVADYNGKMESFWLAETLKYFYLLFSEPDVIPLDMYVFNTEAHPLPIWGSEPDRTMLQRLSPALRARLQSTQALYDSHVQQHRLQEANKMRGSRQHPHS